MRVGVVGYGIVGKHLARLFDCPSHTVTIYDKYDPLFCADSQRHAINDCDVAFVAVPTPPTEAGACDVSAVEEAVGWIRPPICIKSTIAPGTTRRLISTTSKKIVFSPEYIGETPFHYSRNQITPDLVAFGGEAETCNLFISAYQQSLGPEPRYFITDSTTAELAKYMENCFFATKVAFVAQFYLLAEHFGAEFNQMREIWLADSRVGRSHSAVIGSLGFGGRCLPKDLSAIIVAADQIGLNVPLLESVHRFNETLRELNVQPTTKAVAMPDINVISVG